MKHVPRVTMQMIVVCCAASFVGVATAPLAWAAESTPTTTEQTQKPSDGSKLICTREPVMGSNIKKKVCKTQAQIDEEREASQKVLNDLNSSQSRSSGSGG